MQKCAYDIFFDNYDYYWLKYTFAAGVKNNATALLAGHSLPRFGVNDFKIKGLINLSFLSQDFYYSELIIKKALEEIPSLKTVILGTSYVAPFLDLSKARNRGEIARVINVYDKYFHDIHNMDPETYESSIGERAEYDREVEKAVFELYKERKDNYFCRERDRQSLSDIDWSREMPDKDRVDLIISRVKYHNRLLEHKETYEENRGILERISNICASKNVRLLIVVFPSNRYYRKYISPSFKDRFMQPVERILGGNTSLTDLYDSDEFDSVYDFVDTDHLNDKGSDKMTAILREILDRDE